jgi:cell division protein FtsZ
VTDPDAFGLPPFPDPSGRQTVAVVGLGGAGCEAVRDLLRLELPGVRAVAVNTDATQLSRIQVEERILLGQRHLKGRGSGGDRERVRASAEEAREELLRRLEQSEIVFLLAGLGGGTGSALLPLLTRGLRERETLAVPVAFLPFHIELESNPERRSNALGALDELEAMGGLLLALSNEKLRRFESLPMPRVLQARNAYLHGLVASLVDMLEHPGQLNVDLASLKSHLANSGVSTLLLSEEHVEEPERLVHTALSDTLLDFELGESPTALVHVEAGSNLTLAGLDRVWRTMRRRLGEPRRMLVGTRTHPEPRAAVRLTAVVGGLRTRTVRDAMTPRLLAPA